MKNIAVQIGAAAGACAVIAGTAIGVLATHDGPDSGLTAKTEPTEITQTTQVAPSCAAGPQRFAERHRACAAAIRGTGRSRLIGRPRSRQARHR